MSEVRVDLDQAEIRRLYQAGGQVFVFVSGITRRILARAKLYAPVKTGYLRNSGTEAVVNDGPHGVLGVVGFTADYAAAVHEGARPHVIKPKTAGGVLAFKVDGRLVYAKSVRHPGNKGRPFLTRAAEEELASLT